MNEDRDWEMAARQIHESACLENGKVVPWSLEDTALFTAWFVNEVGELSDVLIKARYGAHKWSDDELRARLRHEFGDALVTFVIVARLMELNFNIRPRDAAESRIPDLLKRHPEALERFPNLRFWLRERTR